MAKRLYCSPQRKLCGVCGGIADYFNIDPSLVRLIFVEIALFTAILPCLIAYFIIALIIPQPTAEYEQMFQNTSKRIYRSRDKKLAGVCGGLADFINVDPTIVRLVFLLLVLLFGNGILTYIACAVLFPPYPLTATAQDYNTNQSAYTPPPEAYDAPPSDDTPQENGDGQQNDAPQDDTPSA